MQEMWWCMVVHACGCTCTTPNLNQPGLYHFNEVLSNLSYFAVWIVAATRTSSKINIRSTCVAWKEWTQNVTKPTFFAKFHLCGWYWDSCYGAIYELWCHNNQGQPTLTYNLGTTYHTTYNIHIYYHLHGKELFA